MNTEVRFCVQLGGTDVFTTDWLTPQQARISLKLLQTLHNVEIFSQTREVSLNAWSSV